MDEFQQMALFKKEKEAQKELNKKNYQVDSKERLKKIVATKMRTVMIGALSAIEEHLGFLWGHNSEEELTDGQAYVAELYQLLRSQILDNGNTQIRNAQTEIDMYTVEWNRYTYQFDVKPKEEKKD